MPAPFPARPTWAQIDLDQLAANFLAIKSFCGPGLGYMAVIKANAYGHGAVECAETLQKVGADWLAVATMEEGIELRDSGITLPILILGGSWPGQERTFIDFRLTPIVFDLAQAERFDEIASAPVDIHLKVDTGMNRVGFRPEKIREAAGSLSKLRHVRVQGVMTHFAAADDPTQNEFTEEQISRFAAAVDEVYKAGHTPEIVDLANSPGAIVHPRARSGMVRIGGLLFGIADDVLPRNASRPQLEPVMSLHTRIAMVKSVPKGESIGYGRTFTTEKDSVIATVPIGYNDGLDRRLSNCGEMIVRGRRVPVVGRVSMDWVTLDVSTVPDVQVGDDVVALGGEGQEMIRVEEIAGTIGTLSYEVTCGIAPRVQRLYTQTRS